MLKGYTQLGPFGVPSPEPVGAGNVAAPRLPRDRIRTPLGLLPSFIVQSRDPSHRDPGVPLGLSLKGPLLRRRVAAREMPQVQSGLSRLGEERSLGFPRGNSSSFPRTAFPGRSLLLAEVTGHLRLGVSPWLLGRRLRRFKRELE